MASQMDSIGSDTKDLERDVKLFVQNYVSALKKLVEEKRQQIESINIKPSFPTEFPVKAVAYLGRRGIILHFEKADSSELSVIRNERPPARSQWGEFISYSRFSRIKDKASKKAESDIIYLLNLPKMIEEHEREMEHYYEALLIEEMSYTVEDYVKFLDKAKEVVDETRRRAMTEVHEMIEVIRSHLSNFEYMLRVGCKALNHLYFMINSDLETSLFLALNGKYFAAIAILRKILEVKLRCAYLDKLEDRAIADRKTEEWIDGGKIGKTFQQIVNDLLADQIDHDLTGLLNRLGTFEESSFKQSILSLYKELCVYVHLRPPTPQLEDLRISFSEFNLEKFHGYYSLFIKVMKLFEILLVLKFPSVISAPSLIEPGKNYNGVILSKTAMDAIATFSLGLQ